MKKTISRIFTFSIVMFMFCSITFAATGDIKASVQKIVNAVSYFGYAIAMGMLAFLGIKYVMSPANEKADVKQGSINYLIGAILIIGAATFANIIVGVAGGSTASGIINAAGGM